MLRFSSFCLTARAFTIRKILAFSLLVWGTLGLTIVAVIKSFGVGTPVFLDYMGNLESGTFGTFCFPSMLGIVLGIILFIAIRNNIFRL